MKTIAFCVLSIFGVGISCKPQEQSVSTEKSLFSSSPRRDPTNEELEKVVFFGSGCTGFFLENKLNAPIFASARHCTSVNGDATEGISAKVWCDKKGKIIWKNPVTGNQITGTCKRLIAADYDHDIAVYLADMNYQPPRDKSLRVADFIPDIGTKMKMTGFPGDNDRRGRPSTSTNCRVLTEARETTQTAHREELHLRDITVKHNCSTWGGNSGGPMYLENNRIVVGLPYTYDPMQQQYYDGEDPNRWAEMTLVKPFVDKHRTELEAEGIVFAKNSKDIAIEEDGNSGIDPIDTNNVGSDNSETPDVEQNSGSTNEVKTSDNAPQPRKHSMCGTVGHQTESDVPYHNWGFLILCLPLVGIFKYRAENR